MNVIAPAKLNLCLYLGPTHDDGMHQLVSIFEPLSLRDELTVSEAPADEVLCPAVPGENLATRALRVLRSEGWESPPLKIEIDKKIPVAAGLGGGSADAAAVLRLAGGEVDDLAGIAATLGADVPSQIDPVTCLVEGVGQKLTTLPVAADHWIVLLPGGGGLSTAEVFAEADRIGIGRSQEELDEIATGLSGAARQRPREARDLPEARDRLGDAVDGGSRGGLRGDDRIRPHRLRHLRRRGVGSRGSGITG